VRASICMYKVCKMKREKQKTYICSDAVGTELNYLFNFLISLCFFLLINLLFYFLCQ
jgi:hypothetical protein